MTESYLLAIDQGTTNTKVIIVNSLGQDVAQASRPVNITFPKPAWVEQDALQIWQSVRAALDDCLTKAKVPIAAIGISNQRESVLLWERSTGKPLGPVISWQCRRSAEFCAGLEQKGLADFLHKRTGLTIDPLFSASKARWLLDHSQEGQKRAEAGELCIGTVDSWLLYKLTGHKAHKTDVTNASRTQLFNLESQSWDDDLLSIFGIPKVALPEVLPSSSHFGETVALGELAAGLPIAGMIGDSHGALFGQAGFERGSVKATYGTGSSLMTPTEKLISSDHGLSSTIAWGQKTGVTYALEGNISSTGAAVAWLVDLLGLESPKALTELAQTVESSEGVSFVPAFVGLGAPYWKDKARGTISGLTRGSSRAHMARAGLESIVFQIRDVFDLMAQEAQSELNQLMADGGASSSDFLMQLQADVLGVPVLRNRSEHLSALGAAYLAGLELGLYGGLEAIAALPRELDRFEPKLSESSRKAAYDGWQAAIRRTLFEA
ncbi:MAG: glycerol kinase GlpK [Trueperaceae bacterium]|nr:glycerol kinase GlpK [Trueperaceae bacterium]